MALSTALCLFLLLPLIVYKLAKATRQNQQILRFQRARGCGLPPQTPNTCLGLFQVCQLVQALSHNRFLNYVQGLFWRFGNTFAYNTLGTQSIWTIDPENIQACLANQSQDFEIGASRHKALVPLVGHSILTTDGSIWAQHRAMLRPNFSKNQLTDLNIFEKHFSRFLDCIPQDRSTFDIRELIQKLTMDIGTDFLLGHSTNSLGLHLMGMNDAFADAWDTAIAWLPLRCHLGALMNWIPHPAFFRACKTIHTYADQLVQSARTSQRDISTDRTDESQKRYIFLHELAKKVTDPVQLRHHTISVLTAGRDTTAETLSCTISLLTKHCNVMDILRREVDQLCGQKPTVEDLKNMKYLRNVLLEVLRLYPIAPVNARIALRDTTLPLGGGPDGKQPIMVRKGQQVLYCVYGLHRRKDLYGADANDFRPERWEHRRQGGWDFLPFNGGARNCLGQNFAMIEASYILVRLLQEFDEIEARDRREWQERLGLILTNLHGTLVGVTRNSVGSSKEALSSRKEPEVDEVGCH